MGAEGAGAGLRAERDVGVQSRAGAPSAAPAPRPCALQPPPLLPRAPRALLSLLLLPSPLLLRLRVSPPLPRAHFLPLLGAAPGPPRRGADASGWRGVQVPRAPVPLPVPPPCPLAPAARAGLQREEGPRPRLQG